jgi:hypothetical protein
MNERPNVDPDAAEDSRNDELDDAIINADDTGMVANQHLIVEGEMLLGSNDPRRREGEGAGEAEQPPSR